MSTLNKMNKQITTVDTIPSSSTKKSKRQSSFRRNATKSFILILTTSTLCQLPSSCALQISRTVGSNPNRSFTTTTTTTLYYRVHDENGPPQQPQQPQQQLQDLPPHRQSNDYHISSWFHTFWTRGKTRRAREQHALQMKGEDEEQCVLDDYLESIDRRYKRMKCSSSSSKSKSTKTESSSSSQPKNQGFTSALQWLKETTSSSHEEEQRRQEDAIYLLDLTGLASTKLLQRHHLPIPESKLNKSIVIDIAATNPHLATSITSESENEDTLVSSSTHFTSTSRTGIKTRMATVAPATFLILQMLRHLQSTLFICQGLLGRLSKQINVQLQTIQQKEQEQSVTSSKGKNVIASVLTFLTNTSGGKHSFQVASMMIASVFAFGVSILRPMTKA